MIAVTAEGWVLAGLGLTLAAVAVAVYLIRGGTDERAEGSAGLVKLQAPAYLFVLVLGVGLVLVGLGFVSLGGGTESAAEPAPTIRREEPPAPVHATPTTTTTSTTLAVLGHETLPDHPPVLAATGTTTQLAQVGTGLVLVGATLRRMST